MQIWTILGSHHAVNPIWKNIENIFFITSVLFWGKVWVLSFSTRYWTSKSDKYSYVGKPAPFCWDIFLVWSAGSRVEPESGRRPTPTIMKAQKGALHVFSKLFHKSLNKISSCPSQNIMNWKIIPTFWCTIITTFWCPSAPNYNFLSRFSGCPKWVLFWLVVNYLRLFDFDNDQKQVILKDILGSKIIKYIIIYMSIFSCFYVFPHCFIF